MNALSPAVIGFLRGLMVAVIIGVLTFLANAANLHGIVPDSVASLIAMLALSFEHTIAAGTNTALFGSVTTKRIQ